MSKWKERKRARMLFKRLKVGLATMNDLSAEDIALLKRYYPFIFKP